jgi:prepilin-type N-terminal cleavage/methylation domain-containing protein
MISQERLATLGAFTLVEVMLALAVSAIVLAAIGGVFFSAMRLRERTTALLDDAAPMQQALSFLRRDLKGAVGPGGVLESDFRDGNVETAVGQGFGLQFCTTTGVVKDSAPWGDIQEVIYQLKDPTERNANTSGRDLVRSITRNLLATSAPDYQDQVLLSNVKSVDFFCFDGSQWRDNWDTGLSDTNLPSAVRVRIQMAGPAGYNASTEPLEMVVPLMVQLRGTNQTSTATNTTP